MDESMKTKILAMLHELEEEGYRRGFTAGRRSWSGATAAEDVEAPTSRVAELEAEVARLQALVEALLGTLKAGAAVKP